MRCKGKYIFHIGVKIKGYLTNVYVLNKQKSLKNGLPSTIEIVFWQLFFKYTWNNYKNNSPIT